MAFNCRAVCDSLKFSFLEAVLADRIPFKGAIRGLSKECLAFLNAMVVSLIFLSVM